MTGSSAHTAYRARRIQAGAQQKSFLLSPGAVAALARLAKPYGSQTKAIEAAVRALEQIEERK